MNITIEMSDFGKLSALISKMGPAGRAQLNRVAVNVAAATVQRHIRSYAMGKHGAASDLGASPTGHYEKGMAAIVGNSNANEAYVVIPIPGIGLAYHDIVVKTPTGHGKSYLTIPKHAAAYGHTVGELKKRGWKIFRPGKSKCLLGYRNRGDKPVMLYSLAEGVHKRQDPRLLPSKQALAQIFAQAQKDEIQRVMRKAGK